MLLVKLFCTPLTFTYTVANLRVGGLVAPYIRMCIVFDVCFMCTCVYCVISDCILGSLVVLFVPQLQKVAYFSPFPCHTGWAFWLSQLPQDRSHCLVFLLQFTDVLKLYPWLHRRLGLVLDDARRCFNPQRHLHVLVSSRIHGLFLSPSGRV